MPDGDLILDFCLPVVTPADVNDGPILQVRARTNADRIDVAAHRTLKPDVRPRTNFDVANHTGTGRHEDIGRYARCNAAIGQDNSARSHTGRSGKQRPLLERARFGEPAHDIHVLHGLA